MNRVACTVSEGSGAILDEHRKPRPGTNSHELEKFPRHVLVIDDEPLIRWSVAESLADAGYIVEQAADAASALKIVADTALRFQVVVMDLRLPDMHDLSLLATFRQVWPDARVILMTAFGTPEILARARALGAEVLNKPFELDELNRLVQSP
jgi:DNA-binding NtrC family response regulator